MAQPFACARQWCVGRGGTGNAAYPPAQAGCGGCVEPLNSYLDQRCERLQSSSIFLVRSEDVLEISSYGNRCAFDSS